MNPTYKLVIAIVVLLIAGYLGHWMTDNHWQAKYDQHLLADAQANEKAAVEMLTKQQKLLQELDNAYKAQKHLQEKHDRNVADSRAVADRLRAELDRIKELPAVNSSSTLAERANAATDRRVLAGLLASSDYLAGRFAEEADKLRVALSACNSEYDAVRLTAGGG